MTRLARTAVVGLLLAVITLTATLIAPSAWAHAVRLSTDPAVGARLSVGPARVGATFNERLQPTFAAMTVVGPDGNLWSSGGPQVAGAVVSVGVRELGPAGRYTVNYRVTSADGHVVSGSWSFELTTPGTGTPDPAAVTADNSNDDIPVWPFAVGALVLVAGAVVWAVRHRP